MMKTTPMSQTRSSWTTQCHQLRRQRAMLKRKSVRQLQLGAATGGTCRAACIIIPRSHPHTTPQLDIKQRWERQHGQSRLVTADPRPAQTRTGHAHRYEKEKSTGWRHNGDSKTREHVNGDGLIDNTSRTPRHAHTLVTVLRHPPRHTTEQPERQRAATHRCRILLRRARLPPQLECAASPVRRPLPPLRADLTTQTCSFCVPQYYLTLHTVHCDEALNHTSQYPRGIQANRRERVEKTLCSRCPKVLHHQPAHKT